MAATVSKMTKDELTEIIEKTVERKLIELLGDPDEGLIIKKPLRDRLARQRKAIASGQRRESLASVTKRLRLKLAVCIASGCWTQRHVNWLDWISLLLGDASLSGSIDWPQIVNR